MTMVRSVSEGPIHDTAEGVVLQIQVLPRSSHCRVAGCQGGFIRIKITAPPVEGKANEECLRFFADILGIKKENIRITAGHRSRKKLIAIQGLTKKDVAAILCP